MSIQNRINRKSAAKRGETPRIELGADTGVGVSSVFVGSTDTYDEEALLRGWGLDPTVWAIQTDTLRVNRWLQNAEQDLWAYQFKASVTKR